MSDRLDMRKDAFKESGVLMGIELHSGMIIEVSTGRKTHRIVVDGIAPRFGLIKGRDIESNRNVTIKARYISYIQVLSDGSGGGSQQ